MLEIILTVIASLLLVLLSLHSLVRQKSLAGLSYAVLFILLAFIGALDQCSLHLSTYDPMSLKRASMLAESFLPLGFLSFSLLYSRRGSCRSISPIWWLLIACTVAFPLCLVFSPENAFFYSPDFRTEKVLFLGRLGYWFYLGIMLYCIIALANIEATFSAVSGRLKWQMKFEVIGISSILAVMIFYYSQGLLYRTINMNLIPVRSAVFIVASCLIAYSRIFRGHQTKTTVSRYIFYRSLTLLFVGLYLLILGAIGEGIKYLDIPLTRDLAYFAAFAVAIMMVIIFLSERLRRRAKVFINKNFYTHKHDYRDEWLSFTERLGACRSFANVKDSILTTYKATFMLAGVSLYLLEREDGAYVYAAGQSMPGKGLRLRQADGLFSYFKERRRVFRPGDGEYTPSEEEASFVNESGAKTVVPLIVNGDVEGLIVFGQQMVRDEFTYEDYDLMKTIARQAAVSILNFRLSEELGATRGIAAAGKISSFVMHDLKNLASILALTLDNAEKFMEEPAFQKDMVTTTRNTLSKMKCLIQKLKGVPRNQTFNKAPVAMDLLVGDVIDEVKRARPDLTIEYDGSSAFANVDDGEVRKVILNLMLNAADAVEDHGTVRVTVYESGDSVRMSIADDGMGMSEEFVAERLFKPFQSTKKEGLGIGLYQCRQIVDAHSGKIEVESEVGTGSVFTVCFPSVKGKVMPEEKKQAVGCESGF